MNMVPAVVCVLTMNAVRAPLFERRGVHVNSKDESNQ